MNKTKIEWADSSWNPVSGCLHKCGYCYARTIAGRFGGCDSYNTLDTTLGNGATIHELDRPAMNNNGTKAPYPFGFEPTFHKYRLGECESKAGRTIFVGSMADIFGSWVPQKWIEQVFDARRRAPQHRYLFLTKNPGRYCDLERAGVLPEEDNFWFGATYDHSNWCGEKVEGRPTTFSLNGKCVHDAGDWYFPGIFWKNNDFDKEYGDGTRATRNRFVSFEPLLYDIGAHIGSTGGMWHIIGAETGTRAGKVKCKKEWVDHIVEWSDKHGIPVFMKDSLIPVVGEENMRRDFPWN